MANPRLNSNRGVTVNFICMTCGTQFAESAQPPARCPICEDERQYVGLEGQKWRTLDELAKEHKNEAEPEEPGLTSCTTAPKFGIGSARSWPKRTRATFF